MSALRRGRHFLGVALTTAVASTFQPSLAAAVVVDSTPSGVEGLEALELLSHPDSSTDVVIGTKKNGDTEVNVTITEGGGGEGGGEQGRHHHHHHHGSHHHHAHGRVAEGPPPAQKTKSPMEGVDSVVEVEIDDDEGAATTLGEDTSSTEVPGTPTDTETLNSTTSEEAQLLSEKQALEKQLEGMMDKFKFRQRMFIALEQDVARLKDVNPHGRWKRQIDHFIRLTERERGKAKLDFEAQENRVKNHRQKFADVVEKLEALRRERDKDGAEEKPAS